MDALPRFQSIRQAVFDQMLDNSILLLGSAPVHYRNSDTEYPYRQDSYFYYLTGFEESEAIIALIKNKSTTRLIVFCQEIDPKQAQWVGAGVGVKGAIKALGADEAFPITQADDLLPDLLNGMQTIYYLVGSQPDFEKQIFSAIERLRKKVRQGNTPHQFIDLRKIVNDCRLIKSPEELQLMRKACEISIAGHLQAMEQCRPGMHEYELEAILLHEFCKRGARDLAYTSIVAGGNNACTLHYTRNNASLKDNTLVLIDAGAEFHCYAADITRTFPVNGKFTSQQQAIYELVLASQTAAIERVAPGLAWEEIQSTIVKILVTGLVDLKILKGDVARLIEDKAYLPFYMHNSGHWLGLDVHDVGSYQNPNGTSRTLASGMVLTVEPGLYLSADNRNIPEQWRGIGVRIEDDVCVTSKGNEVLSGALPKTVSEIEKLMQRKG